MELKTIYCPACGYKMQFSKPKIIGLHFIKDCEGIISTRLFRGLTKISGAGIITLEDLSELTQGDLLKVPNIGKTSFEEARELLATIGLDFRC